MSAERWRHWSNCVAHFDDGVETFLRDYFGSNGRTCLLVCGAGFDPRATRLGELLASVPNLRLAAWLVREERAGGEEDLRALADANEQHLRSTIATCETINIDVFGSDGASVGGRRIVEAMESLQVPGGTTDVVLDFSALSTGVAFPTTSYLLRLAEDRLSDVTVHLVVASSPETDDGIRSELDDTVTRIHGFLGPQDEYGGTTIANVWLPQLARHMGGGLRRIGAYVNDVYKTCPIVPFPASDPHRADALLDEYRNEILDEWSVDARDVIHVAEHNPLDTFRTITTLQDRYGEMATDTFRPRLVLSPVGSKVVAIGAMMAALKHSLCVEHIETRRYVLDRDVRDEAPDTSSRLVHLILDGPLYDAFPG